MSNIHTAVISVVVALAMGAGGFLAPVAFAAFIRGLALVIPKVALIIPNVALVIPNLALFIPGIA